MAIHKKDRKFSKIMKDIELVSIPMSFVKTLTMNLEDGKEVIFTSDDLRDEYDLETFLMNSEFKDDVLNLRVDLDVAEIENIVTEHVNSIFNKVQYNDNKGNNSM